MTGSGNDFVFVDGRVAPVGVWTAEKIRWVCSRQMGVGADGLVVLEPGSAAGSVRLHYFNSDGFRAALCGNASLCAARLTAWLELGQGVGAGPGVVLETDAGLVRTRCLEGAGELAEIDLPGVVGIGTPAIDLQPGEKWARFATVGVPHLVVLVDGNLAKVDVVGRGRALRHHKSLEPDGANVSFVASGPDGWAFRTYERGVEAETLACGTGSVAVAAILVGAGLAELPVSLRTASGCTLTVSRQESPKGGLGGVRLAGEGRLVFRAILRL
ncbi:MAG: diaminopimelate epimerase [Gemmatimonadetes bacterium]|nr:diaminopimelate epimerase [Gemmatimonadota bacterium]